jgi:DNA replication protein DnaC
MNAPTMEKLYELRLGMMAEAWQQQSKDPKAASIGFDERFPLLVEAEHLARDNRRLGRLLKDAQLRLPSACLEDIDASPTRGLEKALVRQLGTCSWVHEHLNVLLTGATGVGKSYVACALGQSACKRGHRVLYRRVPRLLEELALARLAKVDVLILDDWGLGSLKEAQRHDLLEVLEDRYGRASTVVTRLASACSAAPVERRYDRRPQRPTHASAQACADRPRAPRTRRRDVARPLPQPPPR